MALIEMNRWTDTPIINLAVGGDRTTIIAVFDGDQNYLGNVVLDDTDPIAVRHTAGWSLHNAAHKTMSQHFERFEDADGVLSGLWAALRLKLAEPGVMAKLNEAERIIKACQLELRALFV